VLKQENKHRVPRLALNLVKGLYPRYSYEGIETGEENLRQGRGPEDAADILVDN
jgi:hypothetical protein